MSPEFSAPDLRQVCIAARRYLDGAVTIHELNGVVAQALDSARLDGSSERVVAYLESWRAVVNRRWNEWAVGEPLSEESFRTWLREQLVSDSEPPAR